MTLTKHCVILSALMMTSCYLSAQRPPAGQPDAPGFDLSGYWSPTMHEDALERGGGSELGDYAGFALNEAGRLWALSYDPSRVTLKHHQCDAYVAPYQMRATGNFRIWEERDAHDQHLVAVHVWAQVTEGHRVIWMDGRPHPPAWAPHSFRGFSTGKFVGDALVVETTHMKQGWLRRNGTPESDQATLLEYFVRHGDRLTNTTIVTDPVFLSEPEVRSNDYFRQVNDHHGWLYACDDGEQILDRPVDKVPNYLFGAQPFGKESRLALAERVLKKQVHINSRAIDKYGRLIAELSVNGVNVNTEMVRSGLAWEYSHFHRDKKYLALQTEAQQTYRGLWGKPERPVQPEQWRKLHPTPTRANNINPACGKKNRCSQMHSCEEARFYLLQCGVKSLDANLDGVPCERLCVTAN